MFPNDPIFREIIHLLWMFISNHIYALIVIGILVGYASYLRKKFACRTSKYQAITPREKYFLNLQCQRWERNAHQVRVVILLSVIVAFIIFLFFQMTIGAPKGSNGPVQAGNVSIGLIGNLRIIYYIALISFKTRALLDIRSVLKDLERAKL